MDIFQELGFKTEEEYELYEDVCCELNVIPDINTLDDLLKYLEDESINGVKPHTKKEFEEFIRNKDLTGLFNKVKSMSLLDRYIELYIYHANYLSILINLVKLKTIELNIARSMFDGEEMVNKLSELKELIDIKETHACCINYIVGKVRVKIPFEEDFFFLSIDNIKKEIFNPGNNGNSELKLN